jgi:hypothetical protein
MPYTNDPARDADVVYLFQEKQDAKFEEMYEQNLNDFSVFQSFVHDLDTDDAEIKLFFDQMHGDEVDKVYAYDNLIILYEKYVDKITEMML